MERNTLIKNLEKKGISVVGYSENFNGVGGGIWISAEEPENEYFFNYYAESRGYDLGGGTTLIEFLGKRGWYAEWNDPGTIFIWTD